MRNYYQKMKEREQEQWRPRETQNRGERAREIMAEAGTWEQDWGERAREMMDEVGTWNQGESEYRPQSFFFLPFSRLGERKDEKSPNIYFLYLALTFILILVFFPIKKPKNTFALPFFQFFSNQTQTFKVRYGMKTQTFMW